MFENVIIDQNSHWNLKKEFKLIKRDVFYNNLSLIDEKQILTIIGIRRSGKSYLLKEIINFLIFEKNVEPKNILFLNLENPMFNQYKDNVEYLEKIYEEYLKLSNPKGKKYILFDEIQFFKNWQIFVKSKYELGDIKFIITGSNSWMLSSEFSTLLSGRNIEIKNYNFNLNEILKTKNIFIKNEIDVIENRIEIKKSYDEMLEYGSFPEIVLSDKKNYKEILQAYSKNILFQDIVPRFEIKKISEMEKLFMYLISNYGNLYSYNKLSKMFGLDDKTLKEYIKYFGEAFLFYEIEKFDYSLKKQTINNKKIYVCDNGFINSLSFKFSEDRGRLLENLVFIELKRRGNEIYYHKDKYECDFLIKKGLEIASAVQVTKSLLNLDTKKREFNGLIDACKKYNLKKGLILTEDEEFIEIGDDGIEIRVMPIWKWLLG